MTTNVIASNSASVAAKISNAGQADAIVECGYDGGAKSIDPSIAASIGLT